MTRKALICGVSGQDGTYLANLLIKKGYEVYGTSRDVEARDFYNLKNLKIHNQIKYISLAISDFRNALQVLKKIQPDEIYNLAGQSSVGLSFEQPVETMESISIGTLNLLEGIRLMDRSIKFYNAASSECFGNTNGQKATESTSFHPRSPYAVAKAAAFWQVANYREAYGIHASSGILFNHESPLRHERFVTIKIVKSACRIANGANEKLILGNTKIQRDWGWAPEYVKAMWAMLQQKDPDDYVIATGQTNSLQDFVSETFNQFGLDWQDHVESREEFYRPTDIEISMANPAKAEKNLGWKASYKMADVIRMMIEAERNSG